MKRERSPSPDQQATKKPNTAKHPNETPEQRDLRKQLQFYFSNSNYPRDEFLLDTAKANDGWIPIEVFEKFNKLKQMGGDHAKILVAAKESDYIEVSEDEKMVKRIAPLPEVDDFIERCVFVIGPPVKANVDKFFHAIMKEGGHHVMSVWRARGRPNGFFLEMPSVEEANKLAESGSYTYTDRFTELECTLEVSLRKDYVEPDPSEMVRQKKEKKQKVEKSEMTFEHETGCIIKIPGFDVSDTDHAAIKASFADDSELAFVDTRQEGHILLRFRNAEAASKSLANLQSGDQEISGKKYTNSELMDPEAETTYRNNSFKSKRSTGGRGGRRGGRGRR